ncbi:MAG TPA: hypothetical protein VHD32_05405 [Candidatus Didemnitutus sp.]|nr:hypothetical protein [Candidatus Didemnitutus sp.]
MRQQLILVQVRIMELEDARDETADRLAECQQLLRTTQAIADQKMEEAAHLETVRAGLQTRHDELRHVQHVTNEALEAARADFAIARESVHNLEQRVLQLGETNAGLNARCAELDQRLHHADSEISRHLARIAQLDTELRTMKHSRSWRWTAWLRSVERMFARSRK